MHIGCNCSVSNEETGKVRIPQEAVDEYWAHLEAHQQWASVHPGRSCMPIGIHGDDGRYKPGDKIILVTCNFISGRDVGRILQQAVLLNFLNPKP